MHEWISLMDREYLTDYIRQGGGAVKFLAGPVEQLAELSQEFDTVAEPHGFVRVDLNAAHTRLHRIDHVFFEVARQTDWSGLAQNFMAECFREAGLAAEMTDSGYHFGAIALRNGVDEAEVRTVVRKWLQKLYEDYSMSQEFRFAMLQLCRAQFAGLENSAAPSVLWLKGEPMRISELKNAKIFGKINRHNARVSAMNSGSK